MIIQKKLQKVVAGRFKNILSKFVGWISENAGFYGRRVRLFVRIE